MAIPHSAGIPQYTLHRPSGNARVFVDSREIWLGRYDSGESRERYDRIIAESPIRDEITALCVQLGIKLTVDD